MRFVPPCPNLRRTPPGEHTLRRQVDVRQLGHSACWSAGSLAIFAVLLFLSDLFVAGAVVLGLAAVLLCAGSVLLYRPDPPVTQCTRRYDQGVGRPWGVAHDPARCCLQRGHQGTCVP